MLTCSNTKLGVCISLAVSMQDYQPEAHGFNPHQGSKIFQDFIKLQSSRTKNSSAKTDKTVEWQERGLATHHYLPK